MAKKKSSKNAQLIGIVGLILAVVGVALFLFLDALSVTTLLTSTFEGYKVVFGYSPETGFLDTKVNYFNFGFIPLIVLLLALAGGIIPVVLGKKMNFIGGILMLVACVAIFCITLYAPTSMGDAYTAIEVSAGDCGLEIGTILAGVFFGLGGVANIATKFI